MRLKYYSLRILCIVVFAIFILLFCFGLSFRYNLTNELNSDSITLTKSNIVLNILMIAFLCFLFSLLHHISISIKTCGIITLILIITGGTCWVLLCRMEPCYDPAWCKEIGQRLLTGNIENLLTDSYLAVYSFQLGFCLYSAALQFLFGKFYNITCALLNVVYLGGICSIIMQLFRKLLSKRAFFIMCGFMVTSVQALIFTNYLYGFLPSTFFALMSLIYINKFLCCNKSHYVLKAFIFLSISLLFKPNSLIICIAYFILLFLEAIYKKNSKIFIFSIIILCSAFIPSIVKRLVEIIIGQKFDSEIPTLSYFVMGLQDNGRMPGWWNGYTYWEYYIGENRVTNQQIQSDFIDRMRYLIHNAKYTVDFFIRKITSTWCETTFNSLKINSSFNLNFTKLNNNIQNIFFGKADIALRFFMNIWTFSLYGSFAFGCLFKNTKKELVIESNFISYAFILIIFGNVLYLTFSETQSMYVLPCLLLMIPISAFGLDKLANIIFKLVRKNKN